MPTKKKKTTRRLTVNRGGSNPPPRTPKPNIIPPSQKAKANIKRAAQKKKKVVAKEKTCERNDRKVSPPPRKKKKKSRRPNQLDLFKLFVSWMAIASPLREPKTQKDFASDHSIRPATLSAWKNRKEFWPKVDAQRQVWGKDKTGDIIAKLYASIMKTNKYIPVDAYKLWLEMFADHKQRIELSGSLSSGLESMTDAELDAFIAKKAKALGR